MNYEEIKTLLGDHNQKKVDIFINYLKELELAKDRNGAKKNKWFGFFKASQAVALYKKVAIDNLFIDGETITLTNKGQVMVSYDYNAYKNKLLNIYPNSKFDIQIVCQKDTFDFRKEDGQVKYTHILGDPFSNAKKTIGAYCIIKNERGEFIEVLNMNEVAKMKNVAKTKNIWNTWEDEMILKSVIKRACKRHFKDIVVNIEAMDNENYELDNVDLDSEIQEKIQATTTLEELTKVYKLNQTKVKDQKAFLLMLSEKRKEIEDENS